MLTFLWEFIYDMILTSLFFTIPIDMPLESYPGSPYDMSSAFLIKILVHKFLLFYLITSGRSQEDVDRDGEHVETEIIS